MKYDIIKLCRGGYKKGLFIEKEEKNKWTKN